MKSLFHRSKPSTSVSTASTSMAKNPSTEPSQEPVLKSDPPLIGHWDSDHTTIGAGVAIFHLASSRVVLCYHTHHHYWFLPKGRRDANEDTGAGAEREGFEESGYRNRLLPLPLPTCQPRPHNPSSTSTVTPFVTEPVWTQLAPVSRSSQYILFWYIAETVPPDIEESLSKAEEEQRGAYQYPPKFDADMTFQERIEIESGGYEPVRHENTGVDEEEAFYESQLVPVEEALKRLRDAVSCDVVSKGWEAIKHRKLMEAEIPAQERQYCVITQY